MDTTKLDSIKQDICKLITHATTHLNNPSALLNVLEYIRLYFIKSNHLINPSTIGWIESQSNLNQIVASHCLGVIYAEGYCIAKKYAKAIELFQSCAAKQFTASINYLGTMYFKGLGVEVDYLKAADLYRMSAEQGYAAAQCNLAQMYWKGSGIGCDYEQAAHFFKLSADQGISQAQCALGEMHRDGQGIETDLQEAIRLFELSSRQGFLRAQFNLAHMYLESLGVMCDCKKAIQLLASCGEQGYAPGFEYLGDIYYYGIDSDPVYEQIGIERNTWKAYRYYKRAMILNHKTQLLVRLIFEDTQMMVDRLYDILKKSQDLEIKCNALEVLIDELKATAPIDIIVPTSY